MAKEESHSIRNGVIATVVGGLILAFVPSFRNLVAWLWGLLRDAAAYCWQLLVAEYGTPGWALLLLAALSLAFVIPRIGRLFRREPRAEDLYKEDRLFGAIWRWGYSQYGVINLHSLCPACQAELVYRETTDGQQPTYFNPPNRTEFICENGHGVVAQVDGDNDYAEERVKREIRRKIRTSEWKSAGHGGGESH